MIGASQTAALDLRMSGLFLNDLDVLLQAIRRIIRVPDSPGIGSQSSLQRTENYSLVRECFDLFRKQGDSQPGSHKTDHSWFSIGVLEEVLNGDRSTVGRPKVAVMQQLHD